MRRPPPDISRLIVRICDISFAVGLWVLLAGGAVFQRQGARRVVVELSLFGPLLAPSLILMLAAPRRWRASWVGAGVSRGWRWVQRLPPRTASLAGAAVIAIVGAFHLAANVNRYLSFRAGMDLAIYGNACRNELFSTVKGDASLLADHFEPLLLFFAPWCARFDPATVLLIAAVAAWCAGAAGIYALARAARWSRESAALVAALYLFFAGAARVVAYDFHLITLALGVVPWIWYALLRRRFALFWLLAAAWLGLKESAALSIVGLGAYLVIAKERRARVHGALLVLAGGAAFAAIMAVIYPHFRAGAESFYFAKYYSHLGRSLPEFVATALHRPLYFAASFITSAKIAYVAKLFLPFLLIPLLSPSSLLCVLPAIFINVAANDPLLVSGRFHYEAEIYPTLFSLTVVLSKERAGLARRWAERLTHARLPSLRTAWLLALTVGFSGAGLGYVSTRLRPETVHLYLDRKLAELVPFDKKIAANQRVAAHLTARPALYVFDYWGMQDDWQKADLIVVAYPDQSLGWYSAEDFEREIVARFSPRFELVYQDPFYASFRIWRQR